jgi:hypothetical protein
VLAAYEQERDTALTLVYAASLAAAQQTGSPAPAAQLAFWRALARLPEDADRVINGLVRTADDQAAILARAGAGRAGHGRYTSRGLAASDCCSALAAAARVGGGTEDQPHGAVPGEVVPAPVEQHENTIAKADQFDDMQPQPRQPGEEA